jgi:hypothetical protein
MALRSTASDYLYLVRTKFANPDRAVEWNAWYDQVHAPDMMYIPGMIAVTRYGDVRANGQYLALYEIESPDVFENPRYAQVTGWGEWHAAVLEWRRIVTRTVAPEQFFRGGANR